MDRSRILLIVIVFVLFPSVVHFICFTIDRRANAIAAVNRLREPYKQSTPNDIKVQDSAENLLWFIQISDLHLSAYGDQSRETEFKRFCKETIPTVLPEFVSVSGDLTDARTQHRLSSSQYQSEWTLYSSIIHESGILNFTKVLDIRGNHDMFDVVGVNHSSDYFRDYGVQGRTHARSYSHMVQKPFGNYSIISLDACPKAGVKFPLNFFGELTQDEEKHIHRLVSLTKHSNHTFWFGHYPTSTIISRHLDLRGLLGETAFAYFCGHLHTGLGLVRRMYVLQPQGFLELELGDWREKRLYRIVAIDHDLVSFVDTQIPKGGSQWPVILITNPKDANFLLPHKEPADRIASSTHIRILVWSDTPIDHVSVSIDGKNLGNAVQKRTKDGHLSPLFTLPWNASQWIDASVHSIQVEAADTAGNKRIATQKFVVGRAPTWQYALLASFALHSDHTQNLRIVFYLLELLVFCFLLFPRVTAKWHSHRWIRRSRFLLGLYRFAQCDPIYGLVLFFLAYQCCGPTFMGFLIGSHFGVVFSFGIFIAGTFVLESLTYFYEMMQLFLFVFVYLIYLIRFCGRPLNSPSVIDGSINLDTTMSPTDSSETDPLRLQEVRVSAVTNQHLFGSIPVPLFVHSFVFTCLQLIALTLTVGIPYGFVAACLSPGRLLPIFISWFAACRLNFHLNSGQNSFQ